MSAGLFGRHSRTDLEEILTVKITQCSKARSSVHDPSGLIENVKTNANKQ